MKPSPTRLDLRKARVLLVDDNSQSLDLMMQVLAGFRIKDVKTCRSAAEARSTLKIEHFDLILVDGEMPEEDGFSFTRSLRADLDNNNSTAPIILVSGHTPMSKIQRARDAGANLVVKKPVSPSILLSRISRLGQHVRQFVVSDGYIGPDRRFKTSPLPAGKEERRADAIALTSVPERAMSQDEVDSLFG